jgi:hypothetical protein
MKFRYWNGASDAVLVRDLERVLGCDPQRDLRILAWRFGRERPERVRRKDPATGKSLFTRKQRLAADRGLLIPPASGLPTLLRSGSDFPKLEPYAVPVFDPLRSARLSVRGRLLPNRGKPKSLQMDFCNQFLLGVFPQLRNDPMSLAALERLHGLEKNLLPHVRLPTPEQWKQIGDGKSDENRKEERRARLLGVYRRSEIRIARALRLRGTLGVTGGTKPARIRKVQPGSVVSAQEIDKVLKTMRGPNFKMEIPSPDDPRWGTTKRAPPASPDQNANPKTPAGTAPAKK